MRQLLLRAGSLALAGGVLVAMTVQTAITSGCAADANAGSVPPPAAPPAATAPVPPSVGANGSSTYGGDGNWRYLGATKAAPIFMPYAQLPPPPAQAPPPQVPQAQALPPQQQAGPP